jgi:hypothetical protein
MATRARASPVAVRRVGPRASGKSLNALARASGVAQPVLSRFMACKRGLTLATARRLAACLGLELGRAREGGEGG